MHFKGRPSQEQVCSCHSPDRLPAQKEQYIFHLCTRFLEFPLTEKQPVTDCMKLIFPLLIANNFKRALVLGTCSFVAPEDKSALKWKASVVLVKIIGGSAYDEFKGMGEFVTSQDPKQLKWTLFRVPFLGNGPAAPVMATYTGSGRDGMFISRKSIVSWVLQEIGPASEWIGKAPVLCN